MSTPQEDSPRGSSYALLEVAWTFLRLGCISFGGPIAHLGYLRAEFVERRRWLDDGQYGDLVAFCQFLPGPASSQVVFALGMLRAGLLGALASRGRPTLGTQAGSMDSSSRRSWWWRRPCGAWARSSARTAPG